MSTRAEEAEITPTRLQFFPDRLSDMDALRFDPIDSYGPSTIARPVEYVAIRRSDEAVLAVWWASSCEGLLLKFSPFETPLFGDDVKWIRRTWPIERDPIDWLEPPQEYEVIVRMEFG